MKTILKITASLLLNFLVLQLCYCQQPKAKKVNNKAKVHISKVQSSTQTVCKTEAVKKNPTDSLISNEHKNEALSLTDLLLSNKEDVGIIYQAYNRVRLTSNNDSIQISLMSEIEKIKTEINQNTIDYSKLVYSEKDPQRDSRSISVNSTTATNLEKEQYSLK